MMWGITQSVGHRGRELHYDPPAGYGQIYSDEAIVICNKPSGLLSVPGRGPEKADCLAQRLSVDFGPVLGVHRLDMSTSGLMVFARNRAAQSALARQFQERDIQKTYVAVVQGHLADEQGLVDLPLRCDWPNRPKQMVCEQWGKPSQTQYRRLSASGHSSRVSLSPITGRSHQLRVHMAQLGHPILGDELYGDAASAPRLLLHAEKLGFKHPQSHSWCEFECAAEF